MIAVTSTDICTSQSLHHHLVRQTWCSALRILIPEIELFERCWNGLVTERANFISPRNAASRFVHRVTYVL